MNPANRSAGTREKLVEVAEHLFAARGYEATHLEDIASAVGVRKTALYHYFESKETLYLAVLENLLAPMVRLTREVLSLDLPVYERAVRAADALCDLLAERPSCAQIGVRIFVDRTPVDLSPIAAQVHEATTAGMAFMEEAAREGVFRPLSAVHTVRSVMGMAMLHYAIGETGAQLIERDAAPGADAAALRRDQFRDLLFHGILARPASELGA